jgi:hypothetical protein
MLATQAYFNPAHFCPSNVQLITVVKKYENNLFASKPLEISTLIYKFLKYS